MIYRCTNPKDPRFHNYGGRGITVCPEWSDFWTFVEDMGNRPDGHTLDRKDNDLGYFKENCRWATAKEQACNRRPRGPVSPFAAKGTKGFTRTRSGKYSARITIHHKNVVLGTFDCPLMAHLAYKDAVKVKLQNND